MFPSSKRNLVIFAVVVFSCGWLGYGLDLLLENPPEQRLGMLLWLVAPLLTSLLLRAFGGDGWRNFGLNPNLIGNGRAYLVTLLIYPAGAALCLLVGGLTGLISFPGKPEMLAIAFAMTLVPNLIKNVFEEFAWRGYLAPKIHTVQPNDFVGYLVTALVWGGWHIPYYLFFLGPEKVQALTGQSMGIFVPSALLSLFAATIAYNEIRLQTGSLWPALIMHTIGNSLVDNLVAEKIIRVAPGFEFLVAPTHQSILTALFFVAVGLWLRQQRLKRAGLA